MLKVPRSNSVSHPYGSLMMTVSIWEPRRRASYFKERGQRMKVGFIGLGNMGSAIARNLIKAGHALTVYNRTRSRAEPFASLGARIAETPAEAAADAQVLITMLADDAALEDVIFSPGNAISAL